jgi:hypothetical protein
VNETYELTPVFRALLEKLTVVQLLKKFPSFLAIACLRFIASARVAQKIPPQAIAPLLRVTRFLSIDGRFSGSTVLALSKYAAVFYVLKRPLLYSTHELHGLSPPSNYTD